MATSHWDTLPSSFDSAMFSAGGRDRRQETAGLSSRPRTAVDVGSLRAPRSLHWATAPPSLDSMLFSTADGDQLRNTVGFTIAPEKRDLPQVEIRYHSLSVSLDPKASSVSRTLLGQLSRRWRTPKSGSEATSTEVTADEPERLRLSNVSGALRPGTLTLVLGRPGSGKSALLQALAGRLDLERDICSGEITYNGMPQRHIRAKVLPHCVAYVAQQDDHLAALTVRETLEFARRCCFPDLGSGRQGVFNGRPIPGNTARRNDTTLDELIGKQLGLTHCIDSIVGDELRGGVSGGERKRVTIGEMLLGNEQRVVLLDEISTGLDSATAMDVVATQRRVAHENRVTVAMALLQPAPELVMQFDDLVLLADGHLLYHGPVDAAIHHFRALQVACPLDVPLAEFLLDLGTDRQLRYEMASNVRPPRTPSELAAAFRRSPLCAQLMTLMKMPSEYRDGWEAAGAMPETFKQGVWQSTFTILSRESKLVRRNRTFLIGRAFAVIVMALLYGSIFYRVDPLDAQVLMGVLYSVTIFVGLGQSSQVPTRFVARSIFVKQRAAHFFRTKSYVMAQAAVQLPTAVLEVAVFGTTVYLLCGLAPAGTSTAHEVGHLARFLALLLLAQTALSAMFSAIAAASPDVQVGSTLSMLAVLVSVLFGGFLLPVSEIPLVLLPLYWLNPIAWVIRGLAVNHFGDDVYRVCIFDGVDYCERYGKRAGEYALSSFGFPTNYQWPTIVSAAGFLLCFAVVLLVVTGLALERHRHKAAPSRVKLPPPAADRPITTGTSPMKVATKRADASSHGSGTMPEVMNSGLQEPIKHATTELDAISSLGSDAIPEMISSGLQGMMKHPDGSSSKVLEEGNADASSKTDGGSFGSADDRSKFDIDVVVDVPPITPDSHQEFALLEEDTTRRRLTDRVTDIARKAVRASALPRAPATLTGRSAAPVTVAFRGLSYSVSCGRGDGCDSRTYLLKDVNGYAQPRTLTVLMGTSGAGKTTLLDVLAGRKTQGCIEGDILLNGVPVSTSDMADLRQRTGYCEQVDLLCKTATCREAITFSARLRLPREYRASTHASVMDGLVADCLRVLGLADIAHLQVSDMSQEQMKRTAIGVELVAGPSVLLLDEPTSGLDAPSSKMVVDAMRHSAAATGCTVICTIHQPSTELFLAFDRVLLLARGGQVAFFGDIARDAGRELLSYFQGIEGVADFSGYGANPAEWMLEVIGAGIRSRDGDERDGACESCAEEELVDFAKLFRESPLGQRLEAQLRRSGIGIPLADTDGDSPSQDDTSLGMARESPLTQVQALLRRFLVSYWRSRPALVARLGANLVVALVLGAVFFDVKLETYAGVNSGVGLVATSAGLAGIVAFNSSAVAASEARALFYREHATRAYSAVWYVVAGTLAELPVVALSTFIFTVVEFPMVGIWSSSWEGLWRLAAYWLALSANTLLQVAMAQLLVFALPTLEAATVVGALYNALSFTFMGVNPPARAIPSGYRWLYYSVPARYTCALMLSTVFGASDCDGDGSDDEVAVGCRRLEGDLPPSLANVSTVEEMVETMYLAKTADAVRDVAVALLGFLALRALALLVLERVNHQRK